MFKFILQVMLAFNENVAARSPHPLRNVRIVFSKRRLLLFRFTEQTSNFKPRHELAM